MRRFTLGGLIAAPYSPFDTHCELKLATIAKYAESLVAAGVSGAFICGTTGEGLSMTTAERMDVAKRWVEVCKRGPLKVVVHVGHNSQRDSIVRAARRADRRIRIAALPPFFFKPANVEQIVDFIRPVAAAGGGLPFYYYQIPSMTGVNVSMADLLQVGGEHIPHLRGSSSPTAT